MFSFEHPAWSFADNLRKAVKAEFDRAIAEVGETGFEVHGTVRNVRRRLKRVRAAMRLIRPGFADYGLESRALRRIGAEVSALRDAQALVEAVDILAAGRERDTVQAVVRLRPLLVVRAVAAEASIDRDRLLAGLRERLREARVRAELWELGKAGEQAVVPAFAAAYRRARDAKRAARKGTAEDFHQWRKQVKVHAAQLGLMRGLMPGFADGRRRAVQKLARMLGDYQNLSLLISALRDDGIDAAPADKAAGIDAATAVRRRIGKRALKQGSKLFAEPPRAIERRWRGYWEEWQGARRFG